MDTTQIEETVEHLSARIRPQIEGARSRLDELNRRITTFIKERPATALVGAVALGYVVARLARRK